MELLISAFLLGLASTFHCVAMCGPIAMALPIGKLNSTQKLVAIISYHLTRVIVYGLLGLLIGLIGEFFRLIEFLQVLSILMGAFMVIIAFNTFIIKRFEFPIPFVQKKITAAFSRLNQSKNPSKFLFLGALNGLLPCGIVSLALLSSLVSGSSVGSAAFMAAFGLGTLPVMVFVYFFINKAQNYSKSFLQKSYPVVLFVVGALLITRGANLGIPYLSPKFEQTAKANETIIECHVPIKK
ncbi:MAG: sulfite exporter TauE/SafE family protein [Fluviicola sp.]|jgi:sulfite exporter TauE/SafE